MQNQEINPIQRTEMENNPSTANPVIDTQALLQRMDALSFTKRKEIA